MTLNAVPKFLITSALALGFLTGLGCNQQRDNASENDTEEAASTNGAEESLTRENMPGEQMTDTVRGPSTMEETNAESYRATENTDPTTVPDSPYRRARQALIERGYNVTDGPNEVDGTTQALRRFQAENDLPPTGVLDDATMKKLNIQSDRQPTSVDDVENQRDSSNEPETER